MLSGVNFGGLDGSTRSVRGHNFTNKCSCLARTLCSHPNETAQLCECDPVRGADQVKLIHADRSLAFPLLLLANLSLGSGLIWASSWLHDMRTMRIRRFGQLTRLVLVPGVM